MSSKSELQSDFGSVILYSANKIVTYIEGSRIPTINVKSLTYFLIELNDILKILIANPDFFQGKFQIFNF
jgi:hypothetical protein